jgi:hypothetical protein
MAVSLRMSLSCIAGLLAGAVVPALAHSAGPVSIPDGATPASVSAAAGACVVEPFARGPSYLLWGPTDRWDKTYWFVRPEDCPICVTPQGIRLNSITLRLLTFAACTFQVRVSVVGVTDATYPEPNETDVICPGTAVDVTSLGASAFDATIPLPAGCCLNRPAFVGVQFLNPETACGGWTWMPPGILLSAGGTSVDYVNFFSTLEMPDYLMDYSLLGYNNNLWYSIDAACCGEATPALPGTWGKLKSLYR